MCGPDLLSFEQWKAPPQGGAFGDVAGAGGAVMTSCSCPSPCFHNGPVGVLRLCAGSPGDVRLVMG